MKKYLVRIIFLLNTVVYTMEKEQGVVEFKFHNTTIELRNECIIKADKKADFICVGYGAQRLLQEPTLDDCDNIGAVIPYEYNGLYFFDDINFSGAINPGELWKQAQWQDSSSLVVRVVEPRLLLEKDNVLREGTTPPYRYIASKLLSFEEGTYQSIDKKGMEALGVASQDLADCYKNILRGGLYDNHKKAAFSILGEYFCFPDAEFIAIKALLSFIIDAAKSKNDDEYYEKIFLYVPQLVRFDHCIKLMTMATITNLSK